MMGSSVGRVMGGTGIPVAKVLPQQATTPNQGAASVAGPPRGSHGQVRAQSPGQAADPQAPHTNVFLQRPHAGKDAGDMGLFFLYLLVFVWKDLEGFLCAR